MIPQELLDAHGVGAIAGPLGEFIARQRWFGGQGRIVARIVIEDIAVLRESDPVMLLLIVDVGYADGGADSYSVPVGVRPAGPPGRLGPEHLIASGAGGARVTAYDALADGVCAAQLWADMAEGVSRQTCAGVIAFSAGAATGAGPRPQEIRLLAGEQSNTALIWSDRQFLKWIRRLEPGPSIELEMGEALARSGFTHMARIHGSILYRRHEWRTAAPLALLQPFLAGAVDGWALGLDTVRRLYKAMDWEAPPPGRSATAEIQALRAGFVLEAGRLGSVTAEMHLALGSDSMPGGMGPIAVTASTLAGWADEMTAQLDGLLGRPQSIPGALDTLRSRRPQLVAAFDGLRTLSEGGLATRVHGDYHLGQVMLSQGEWFVLDFEGEPKRTPAQRRRHYSPLRDVAGMLRSLDYAAAVALTDRIDPADPRWPGLMAEGEMWSALSREAFWSAYRKGMAEGRILPDSDSSLVIRRAFELDKAVYEVGYEMGHRPRWAAIPLRFLGAPAPPRGDG